MPQAKTLSEREIKVVLAVVAQGRSPVRNRIMILLSYWGGMRVGEIAALKIGNVINEEGVIATEIRLSPEQTKGSRPRSVMLSEKLRNELKGYCRLIKNLNLTYPLISSQKCRDGFTANSLGQEFKTIYSKAGIDGATSHSGRRTFITNLASKGVGVRVLMALAGHQSISTTQLYIDVNDDMKRKAVNLI